jgi:hypothetical protein
MPPIMGVKPDLFQTNPGTQSFLPSLVAFKYLNWTFCGDYDVMEPFPQPSSKSEEMRL